jgi:hypothetical protein
MTNDKATGPTINIDSITGGVNNIGGVVENQTINFDSSPTVSPGEVYDVIVRAVPPSDHAAIEAARRLLELEAKASQAKSRSARNLAEPAAEATEELADDQPEVIEQQSLLAKYRPQIIAALQEMGLTWLQTAFPAVALVRPLIKIALDEWNKQ